MRVSSHLLRLGAVLTLDYSSHHNVLAIQVRARAEGDKKLRSVGVLATICHHEETANEAMVSLGDRDRRDRAHPSESISRLRSSSSNVPP